MSDIRNTMLAAFGMLNESVYDKLKFKAVFLAGGPGSGKSFVLGKAFPEATMSTDEAGNEMYQGGGKWKVINSDHLFTRDLLKVDLPLDIAQKDDPVMFGLQQNVRDEAKKKLALRNIPWLNSMLPIILDGTCKNAEETLKIKEKLESLGYDTYMVFVDTAEEVASQRNASRKRKVPDDFLRKVNNQVRANKDIFEKAFGENFFYADNTPDWRQKKKDGKVVKKTGKDYLGKDTEEIGLTGMGQRFVADLRQFGRKVENPKINNPIGQKIVKTLEEKGGAYLADYFASGEAKGKSGAPMSTLGDKDVSLDADAKWLDKRYKDKKQ